MEKLGIPTVTVATTEFIGLAKTSSESFGAPDQAFVVVPHPVGMIPRDEVRKKAEAAFPDILKAATQWKPSRTELPGQDKKPYPLETVKMTGTVQDVQKFFLDKKLSIGLPIVPPTKDAVQAMLKGTSHKPDEVVWTGVQPRMGVVTVESVAALATMAGCQPQMMPVLLALVEAMQTPSKDVGLGGEWRAETTTTFPTAPLILVDGPIAKELGISSGMGAFGPEMPNNLCVGYFVNLLGDVAGGSVPPDADKTTQGWPGNTVAMVASEVTEGNPWKKSLAEEYGFAATDNVLIFAGGPPPVIENDHASVDPKDLAEVMAGTMSAAGVTRCWSMGGMWILAPEHAQTLARNGWTKDDVKQFLWENAKQPFKNMPPMIEGKCVTTACCPPKEFGEVTPDTLIPAVKSPKQIDIAVVGGPGKQGMWWAYEFSPTPPTMVKIDPWK